MLAAGVEPIDRKNRDMCQERRRLIDSKPATRSGTKMRDATRAIFEGPYQSRVRAFDRIEQVLPFLGRIQTLAFPFSHGQIYATLI